MLVMALPAFSNKSSNPYNYLLYSNMQDEIKVIEFSIANLFLKKFDIFHIHWPDAYINAPLHKALFNVIALGVIFTVVRLGGAKIIWTVHNVEAHDRKHMYLSYLLKLILLKSCDGLIYLSKYSMHKHLEHNDKFSNSSRYPKKIIPHGDYRAIYENSVKREDAMAYLSLKEKNTYLFFGMIREYKGYKDFINLAKKNPNSNFIIAGLPGSEEIRSFITLNSPKNLTFELRLVADKEVQYFFNACDFVVMPYKNLVNSGVIFLALTFNKTMIIPESEYTLELAEQFDGSILNYTGSLEEVNLDSLHTIPSKTAQMIPTWKEIAKCTSEFYVEIINR